ncbi:MAG TPA: energy transducer TonB [Bryobacteraceae bacterium]|nr:energy transducer TonB [Bryobacteraceae bacterium]
MADLSKASRPLSERADEHLERLLAPDLEASWYRSFLAALKELVRPTKLPPLEVSSRPVPVKDIWDLYGPQKKSWVMSLGFQSAIVVLLFTVFSAKTVQQKVAEMIPLVAPDISPYQPKMTLKQDRQGGGGGGGDRSPLPAPKGRLPKASLKQFTPPMVVVNNPNPKLTMDPSLIIPPDVPLPQINLPNYGDPFGKVGGPLSNGPGSGGGIGSGSGGGVGSGKGGGFGPGEGGGVGGGIYRVGGGVTAPALLHKVEPEYSEEARKAKYQGTVVLYVEIDASGRVANVRVVRSLGLGLDEKAVEAIHKWRFRPGYKDGNPVTVAATVEVNFRLL